MSWEFNINYFLIILFTGVVTSISGIASENFGKSYLPERNVDFNKDNCDERKSVTELRLLHEANKFKPTNKELVIIIGYNATDAVNLAKFLTNGNQTIYNKEIHDSYEYDPKRHAQQNLFEYYDNKTKTAYYAHHGEFLKDDYLVNRFLTKKVIDYAEKVKIILTCKMTDGLDKIFQLAHRIVPNLLKFKQNILLVATTGENFDKASYPNGKEISDKLIKMSAMTNSTGEIAQYILNHKMFSGISLASEDARNLIQTILKDLPFAKSNKTEFVYLHPTNSSQENIAACVCYNQPSPLYFSGENVLEDMEVHFNTLKKENCINTNVAGVSHCAKFVEKYYTYISSTYKEMKNFKTSHEFFSKLREMAKHLNFSFSEKTSTYLAEQEPVYNFLFENALPVYQDTDVWSSSFASFLEENLDLHKFYASFLEISNLNFPNSSITEQKRRNLYELFKQMEESPLVTDNGTPYAKVFEEVKQTVYNKNVSWKCIPVEGKEHDYTLEVRGEIVSISYVNSRKCEKLAYIEIFALNTVILDEDLNLADKRVQVGIVAPTWLVMGSRLVNLSGTSGQEWFNSAEDGKINGIKIGAHGKPGRPGESAGHFYGIAENIINSENLHVHANGGNGGAGQTGGNGVKGEDGRTYHFDKFYESGEKPGWTYSTKIKSDNSGSTPATHVFEKILGKPGQNGGRGGHGGFGGQGGFSGDIKILQLGDNPDDMVLAFRRNLPGNMGKMGKGGKGAPGGVNGKDIEVKCTTHLTQSLVNPEICTLEGERKNGNADKGADGETGGYFIGKNPAQQVQKVHSFARIVNNYKNYTRESFNLDVENNKLERFYRLLNDHEEIVESYSVLDLMEEFIDLEKQFDTLRNISVFFSSYDSLLERVKNLNEQMKQENIQDEYKTIPISSMLNYLIAKVDTINLHGFNTAQFSIQSEFETLNYKYRKNLEKAINAEKFTSIFKTFIDDIDGSIEEGREVLKTVHNIIDDVESYLNQDLESVVQEVIKARKEQGKAIDELDDEFKNIQDGIQKKILIGVGKTIFQSLSLINPAMGSVGIASTSILNIIEDNTKAKANDSKPLVLTASLTKGVNSGFKEAENLIAIRKKAVEELSTKKQILINETLKALPADGDDSKVLRKWSSLNDLNKIKNQPLSFSFKNLESNLKSDKEELSKEIKKKNITKYDVALKVIDKFKKTTQIAEIFGEVGKAVKEDQDLLNRLTVSIEDANKNLVKLRQSEDNIYNNIVPILDSMKEKFDLKNNEFSKISKIRLSLVHWQINQQLQIVKNSMESMLKDFKTNDAFSWTMQKLISAVDLLLHVQKQVAELEDEKKKQLYSLSLSVDDQNVIPQSWYVGDIHISRSFAVLNKYYQIHFFEKAYSDWLQAFKQFVFPFAEKLVVLPISSGVASNLQTLINGLKSSESLLNDYKEGKFPPEKSTMTFANGSRSTSKPFYTWSHEQYKTEIDKVLSGEPVTFFANLSSQTINALKFNDIRIKFYGENNKEIEEDLKYFRVILRHEGDSYYKCNNSTFLIRTSPTTIGYGTDEEAPYCAHDYKRIINKDFVLSPYATWTIQITKTYGQPKQFSYLSKYKGKVDLGLEGRGLYIERERVKCRYNELTNFYDLVKNKV